MSFRVSFGLSEILGIFGCYGLVIGNYAVGGILLGMSVLGVFVRYSLELQSKKESNQKIEDVANNIKDVLFSASQGWADTSSKNMH
jgi:hypothetical protein